MTICKGTASSLELYLARSTNWGHYPDRIWNLELLVILRRGGNRSKTSRSKDENQQQTQPTCDAESGNRTQATLVGGERSHHCAIPAPLNSQGMNKGKVKWDFRPLRGKPQANKLCFPVPIISLSEERDNMAHSS